MINSPYTIWAIYCVMIILGGNMKKVLVEFINTWPTCDEHGRVVKQIGEKYKDSMDIKIYQAGKDFSYIKKYGMITKGTLIINQRKKYDRLSKEIIERVILEAVDAL